MASKAKSSAGKVAAGVGIAAALAAAAAGAYYFYGSDDAKKHRKQIKGWVVKAKGDVLERLESMKEVTKTTYDKVVADVMKKYKTVKNASPAELADLSKELQGYWKQISGSIEKKASSKKPASRTTKSKKA